MLIPTLAVGVILATSVLLLFVKSGSIVPLGAVIVAVFEMVPVALPLTTPATVKMRLDPEGMLPIAALMLFVLVLTLAGQTAPPISFEQVTTSEPITAGTLSANTAPLAALGPAFFTVML